MSSNANTSVVPALFAAILCVATASNLPAIWRADVFARGASVLFFLWLLPLGWVVFREVRQHQWRPDFLWLIGALLLSATGVLGSLNVARHAALGLALGGLASRSWPKGFWLVGMLAWLPATGWLARDISGNGLPLRCALLALGMVSSYAWWKGSLR